MKNIIITIDGHSACGKSTLAKSLASKLNYLYIDSGAMYRAVSLFFKRSDLISRNYELKNGYQKALNNLSIDFSDANIDGKNLVTLNKEIVEDEIRNIEISNLVSHVSKNSLVRKKMVAIQQSYALKSNVIMDGRDIGSVVFPNATIKLWVTASVEKRAYRRWLEYQNKGESILLKKVIENLTFRDKNDENRAESPLVRPLNSIEINNTSLNAAETLENALIVIKRHLEN